MKQFDAILGKPPEQQLPETRLELNSATGKGDELPPPLMGTATAPPRSENEDKRAVASINLMGKGETGMPGESIVQLTRKQLYDEIWEISVAGLARKWDIPYLDLMKQLREADIPIPPPGYWTQLRHGKPTTKLELAEPADAVVSLFAAAPCVQTKSKNRKSPPIEANSPTFSGDASPEMAAGSPINAETSEGVISEEQAAREPETYTLHGQTYNVYDRETLYKEVWEAPVTEIAKRYQVSDVAIHKVCKALEIPKPPKGYWAQLRAGKPVSIKPLPKSDKATKKVGLRTGIDYRQETDKEALAFLSGEERSVVLAIASQILLPDEGTRMHPKISAHRQAINEWKRQQKNGDIRGRNKLSAPALAESVSDGALLRVSRIIDALIRAMEPLGCALTDDLNFLANGETVTLSFTEFTDRIEHIPTKEENMRLLQYEEERKRYSWASKPQIRKYDHVFNGRLKVVVNNKKSFRDCQSYVLEDRLGDIMIELYEAAEQIKKAREAREEELRRFQEEERRKEEYRNHYDAEVDKTLALKNLAEDYDTACRIRCYVAAVEASEKLDAKTAQWVEWAKAKADWYDPTVAREDEFFGKRGHEKDAGEKKLGRRSYW